MWKNDGMYTVPTEPSESTASPIIIEMREAFNQCFREIDRSYRKKNKKSKGKGKKGKGKKDKGKKSKGKKSKGRKGKGKNKSLPIWMQGLIVKAGSTVCDISSMYAESKFFPDGRKKK